MPIQNQSFRGASRGRTRPVGCGRDRSGVAPVRTRVAVASPVSVPLLPLLDKPQARLVLAADANANDLTTHGFPNSTEIVARAAGVDPATVRQGIAELNALNTPTNWLTGPCGRRRTGWAWGWRLRHPPPRLPRSTSAAMTQRGGPVSVHDGT